MKVSDLDEKEWAQFLAKVPAGVRALAERLPPDRLYLMKSTGQRVTIASYNEDGTLRVNVTGEFNLVMFSRTVFGISPDDLQECDRPPETEPVGEMLDEAGAEAYINAEIRARHQRGERHNKARCSLCLKQ